MARVVILGAGVSGHTAALHLRRLLGREHEVVVVSPKADWNWIPSNIWVGVGRMSAAKVVFPLAPVYKRQGIDFRQAKAVEIRPEGDVSDRQGAVDIVYTDDAHEGVTERLRYDFLINATGPKLNFAATPGLGPDGHSWSVCTPDHAVQAAQAFEVVKDKLRAGQPQRLVIGVGHGSCTCEGAAFEYAFNVEHELRESGLRELAEVVYLTNEYELGDFGVGGMAFQQNGFLVRDGCGDRPSSGPRHRGQRPVPHSRRSLDGARRSGGAGEPPRGRASPGRGRSRWRCGGTSRIRTARLVRCRSRCWSARSRAQLSCARLKRC
jgi:sulfide:quinone oxidoreductase